MGRDLLSSQNVGGGRDLIEMQSQEVSAPEPQKKPLTIETVYDDLTDGVKSSAIQEVNWLEMWDEASPEQLAIRTRMKEDTRDMESGLIGGNIEMVGQMASLIGGAGQKALITGGAGAAYGLATGGPTGALTAGTTAAAASFPVWMAWDAYKLNTGEAWEALTEYGKKENLSLTKEQTRDMAGFVGMGMATLDFIGLSAVAKPFTRIGKRLLVRSAAQAMSNPSIIKGVLLGGKDAFVSWFTETITEGLQEGVKELGKDAMKAWDSVDMAEVAAGAGQAIATGAGGGAPPTDLPAELNVLLPDANRLGEIYDIMVKESVSAGKKMILTGGLGGVASTASRVSDAKQQKIVKQAELNLAEKGATPQEIATIKSGISVAELAEFNKQQNIIDTSVKKPWQMTQDEFLEQRPPVKGYLYHGSPEGDLTELDPYYHTQLWGEGQGPYATEDIEISRGYAGGRTAKTERRKGAKETGKVNYILSEVENVLDLDKKADWDFWFDSYAEMQGEQLSPQGKKDMMSLVEGGKPSQATNMEAFNALKFDMGEEIGSQQDAVYAIEEWIRKKGFDATTHTEGKSGDKPHKVTVFKGDTYIGKEGKPVNTLKAKVVPPKEVHKKVVEDAVNRGENVPQNVLDEYNIILQSDGKQPKLLTTVERIQPKLDVVEDMQELVGEKAALIAGLEKDKTIDKATRYEMIDGLRTAKTAEEMQLVVDGMRSQLQTGQKRTELRKVIKEKKFQKVENLRKAMGLPIVKKMDKKQLGGLIETLSKYEENDVFLTQRQIETVDKTELAGMRTLREARSALSDKLNVPVEDLQNIKVSSLDRLRYDTALARKNPFYKMLVEDYYAETLESEASYLEREETINDLTKKARKSRKRTIGERFIPTDKRVFAWLESDKKDQLEKDMTKEELTLAKHLQEEFAGALEHLIKIKALETGRENYITNVRRDFLEAWKESGIKSAIKEIFNQQKLDEQTFDILDQKTGDILPLEKFFQFAMKRSGGLEPSQNVAKAAATYFKAFEKKRALDQFMPKMMVFVDAVASDKKTSTGLEADQQLKNFVKEWINTKKGRPTKLLLKPGGKLDIVTKTTKMFITLMDLGFNIPVGAAATVGETVANYVNMGKKKTVIGASRFATKKGRAIVKKHKNYIGKSVWSQLSEPSVGVLDKTTTAMLAFFTESARIANKMFLLGSLTKEEFESGNISKERLAELKLEMGRWRTYAGAKSILGSTTEVGLFTQYKSWAIPILSSTASNIQKLVKSTYSKEARKELTMREVRELGAAIEVTAAALTAISMMEDDDDDTFQGQLTAKVKREALTVLGALDPTFYASEPRMIQFASQVAAISKDLVTLEEYSRSAPRNVRGKSKAAVKVGRLITPRAVKQFTK